MTGWAEYSRLSFNMRLLVRDCPTYLQNVLLDVQGAPVLQAAIHAGRSIPLATLTVTTIKDHPDVRILASPPLGKGDPTTFHLLPWARWCEGTPKEHGEEHLNRPVHRQAPERTAIMVQPRLDANGPISGGSGGRRGEDT